MIEAMVNWAGQSSTAWLVLFVAVMVILVEAIIEFSHTCYMGDRTHRHVWGYGCGACPACELRAAGYAQWTAA